MSKKFRRAGNKYWKTFIVWIFADLSKYPWISENFKVLEIIKIFKPFKIFEGLKILKTVEFFSATWIFVRSSALVSSPFIGLLYARFRNYFTIKEIVNDASATLVKAAFIAFLLDCTRQSLLNFFTDFSASKESNSNFRPFIQNIHFTFYQMISATNKNEMKDYNNRLDSVAIEIYHCLSDIKILFLTGKSIQALAVVKIMDIRIFKYLLDLESNFFFNRTKFTFEYLDRHRPD